MYKLLCYCICINAHLNTHIHMHEHEKADFSQRLLDFSSLINIECNQLALKKSALKSCAYNTPLWLMNCMCAHVYSCCKRQRLCVLNIFRLLYLIILIAFIVLRFFCLLVRLYNCIYTHTNTYVYTHNWGSKPY